MSGSGLDVRTVTLEGHAARDCWVNSCSVNVIGESQHHKLHPYASEEDTAVQVIASYLSDKYSSKGSSFELSSPEERANDLLARRVHDLYIGPIQVRD